SRRNARRTRRERPGRVSGDDIVAAVVAREAPGEWTPRTSEGKGGDDASHPASGLGGSRRSRRRDPLRDGRGPGGWIAALPRSEGVDPRPRQRPPPPDDAPGEGRPDGPTTRRRRNLRAPTMS